MRLILFRDTGTIENFDNYVVVEVDEDNPVLDVTETVDDFFKALDANDPSIKGVQEVREGNIIWRSGDTRTEPWK